MDKKREEIKIDGETYIKKRMGRVEEGVYVIARTYSAGVFAGYLISRNGREVTLRDARRLWYWKGAASLSQLAVEGTKDPNRCKFPCPVDEVILTETIEILSCTERAKKSIGEVPVWGN